MSVKSQIDVIKATKLMSLEKNLSVRSNYIHFTLDHTK